MGVLCPKCQTHQAVVEVITATGEPPQKPGDIIIQKLACKHTYGTEEFMEYKKQIAKLAQTIKGKQLDLEKQFASKAGKMYAIIMAQKSGGRP